MAQSTLISCILRLFFAYPSAMLFPSREWARSIKPDKHLTAKTCPDHASGGPVGRRMRITPMAG